MVLTGQEARAAWRPYRPWFSSGFALAAATVLSGWLLWHRSAAQLTLLGIGCSALFIAAMAWRFGITGFSYSTSGADATFTRRISPLPRKITTPVLAAAGLLSILAATSTGIGSVLSPVATAGIIVWQFGTATWGLVLLAAFVGMAIADLFSRKDRASGGCVLVFLIGSLLASYGLAWLTGGFHQYWALTLEPFRDLWHLLGG